MPNLFNYGDYTLHSGQRSNWLINCDALRAKDWEALAEYIVKEMGIEFLEVFGIPRGGLKLAKALHPYRSVGPVLLVDDVLTTGASMEQYRDSFVFQEAIGVVVFARGPYPYWVRPIFKMEGSDDE